MGVFDLLYRLLRFIVESDVLTYIFSSDSSLYTKAFSAFQKVFDIVQKAAATLGIAVGGVWVYYQFLKGRTFAQRLEPTISGRVARQDGIIYLHAEAAVKNIGLSRFDIEHEFTTLIVHAHRVRTSIGLTRSAEWDHLAFFDALMDQEWLEPGETVGDQHLIEIPERDYVALGLEFIIVSTTEEEWSVRAIVNLLLEEDNREKELELLTGLVEGVKEVGRVSEHEREPEGSHAEPEEGPIDP